MRIILPCPSRWGMPLLAAGCNRSHMCAPPLLGHMHGRPLRSVSKVARRAALIARSATIWHHHCIKCRHGYVMEQNYPQLKQGFSRENYLIWQNSPLPRPDQGIQILAHRGHLHAGQVPGGGGHAGSVRVDAGDGFLVVPGVGSRVPAHIHVALHLILPPE